MKLPVCILIAILNFSVAIHGFSIGTYSTVGKSRSSPEAIRIGSNKSEKYYLITI